jgi:cell division protease FtsH
VNSFYKNLALWLLIGLIMVTLFNLFQSGGGKVVDLDYSDFLAKVEAGLIADVEIREKNVKGTLKEGNAAFKTYLPDDPELIKSLKGKGVKIVAKPPERSPSG